MNLNLCYIAAFAAFLLNRRTRLIASLCLIYMLTEWCIEPFTYESYYVIMAITAMLCCYSSTKLPTSDQTQIFAILFMLQGWQDFYGYLLYIYDQTAFNYNFTGNCIIITLIIALWMTRNGKLESIGNIHAVSSRVRTLLSTNKGKRA